MSFRDKLLGCVLLGSFVSISLVFISASTAAEHEHLTVQPAASYPNKQKSESVTIAADVYEKGDKVKAAFGKVNPYDLGVLPILVVIDNGSNKAIRVDRLRVEYDAHGNGKVEATPPEELRYLRGARQPRANPAPLPIPGVGSVGRSRSNPLAEWEIEGRAFSAKIVPPGETVSGFFYFQTGHRSNSSLLVQGLSEVGSGRELFYFEIPLAPVQ